MNEPERLTIAIKNDLAEIGRVSRIVTDFVTRNRLPAKLAFDLNLSLDEILTNIISYGYEGDGERQIDIRCTLAEDGVTVEVEDDGRPFNPIETPEPDLSALLEDRPIGGLGVHLVRQLMDQLEYRRLERKNLLIMKRRIESWNA
jgi:anti-sigma regulatory factor (Ser/Thr protein kinase)